MGDLRYYTYHQFLIIIVLTLFTALTTLMVVVSRFKYTEGHSSRVAPLAFATLTMAGIAKVVESVIPDVSLARGFAETAISLYLLTVFLQAQYLMSITIISKDGLLKPQTKTYATLMMLMAIGAWQLWGGSLLIYAYTHEVVAYGGPFFVLMSAVIGLMGLVSVLMAHCKVKIHKIVTNRRLAIICGFTGVLPPLVWMMTSSLDQSFVDFIEVTCYFFLFINLYYYQYSLTPSGMNLKFYDSLTDLIQDYLLVLDKQGQVVYRNRACRQSNLFCSDNIDLDGDVETIFCLPAQGVDYEGTTYYRVEGDNQDQWFNVYREVLQDKETLVGWLITVVDVTELYSLLQRFRQQNREAEALNQQLRSYSEVVYSLEKEKRISDLLDLIIGEQEQSVEALKERIEALPGILDADDFQAKLETTIDYNKEILEDVRQTVSAYRHHLGG